MQFFTSVCNERQHTAYMSTVYYIGQDRGYTANTLWYVGLHGHYRGRALLAELVFSGKSINNIFQVANASGMRAQTEIDNKSKLE